jgi:hypothetical protein
MNNRPGRKTSLSNKLSSFFLVIIAGSYHRLKISK